MSFAVMRFGERTIADAASAHNGDLPRKLSAWTFVGFCTYKLTFKQRRTRGRPLRRMPARPANPAPGLRAESLRPILAELSGMSANQGAR
jgi:hypothetical protein